MKIKFGILASGALGYSCLADIIKLNQVDFVFTDSKSETIIELCKINQISIYVGNPRNDNAKLFIKKFKVDVILSINYLFIVTDFIYSHPTKYSINFHGSLLPKYRGRTPHIWAIINNEKEAGITAHLISEGCDEGDIIYQEKIKIEDHITGADLLSIYESRYSLVITEVITKIENNTIKPIAQDHSKASYFRKRTPDDGEINWNWQKERIRNWVRAISNPYPGAFSFINGQKIVINEIRFSEYGFSDTDLNGKIINIDQGLIVKVQNGAIEITDFEIENKVIINVGDLFYAGN